jgi:hypothetical protein
MERCLEDQNEEAAKERKSEKMNQTGEEKIINHQSYLFIKSLHVNMNR